jgi:hypothetical protein
MELRDDFSFHEVDQIDEGNTFLSRSGQHNLSEFRAS